MGFAASAYAYRDREGWDFARNVAMGTALGALAGTGVGMFVNGLGLASLGSVAEAYTGEGALMAATGAVFGVGGGVCEGFHLVAARRPAEHSISATGRLPEDVQKAIGITKDGPRRGSAAGKGGADGGSLIILNPAGPTTLEGAEQLMQMSRQRPEKATTLWELLGPTPAFLPVQSDAGTANAAKVNR
jgi:hypothetical protein